MTGETHPDKPVSLRNGMILGALWSIASVGWIACLALMITWFKKGWDHAFFSFGLILLLGAGLFFLILVFAMVCELLNITSKRSRRDCLNYFAWAFSYNLVIGGIAFFLPLAFGSFASEETDSPTRSEQADEEQSYTTPR
ncbi:MAG: hypothetical protein AAGJ79_05110 [Verrucomicrobiota bacterium]